ncbi:MAG: hypothetical protein QXT38_03100 [Candidatus Aenigmatarchaeota archaeon]
MSFITQGKTNWKNILIIGVLFIIISGGFLIYQNWWWREKDKIETLETKIPEVAVEEKLKRCEKIKLTLLIEKTNCYINIFKKESDVRLCEKIEEEKDLCYMGLAIAKMDNAFCEKIEDRTGKKLCYAEVTVSKSDINQHDQFAACGEIPDEMAVFCYAYIFFIKGYGELSCEDIQKQNQRDICYTGAAIAKKNENICEKVSLRKDGCYGVIAVIKQDEKICEKTKNKVDCYIAVAKDTKDTTKCSQINEKEARAICYTSLAQEWEDEKVCDEIKDIEETSLVGKYACYTIVALSKGPEVCENIKESSARAKCYFSVAVYVRDEKLCERTGQYMQECYRYFNR